MQIARKRHPWISGFVLVLAAAWIAGTALLTDPAAQGKTLAPQAGFPAPAFTLNTLSGDPIGLEDFTGKVVVLNFWASWCPPCKAEMPAFEALQQAYQGQDVVILAVNTTYQDDLPTATQFVADRGLTFPILIDADGQVSKAYQVLAMPSSFFIDRKGVIQQVIIGGPMSEALVQTQVQRLLAEEP
ncbi:peroxiredoxin [Longilinea arvoryzae]|uniref:Peroxiredoxin n=1 Tax=Longilinea arvoryzae TaxID=360412 RepID=A0A0S7BBG9_9CHLR|nr:TlpA disulfide reductase family protein [Longilinea arvoryzae]GAP14974.1 peroxiredoxin [Longilinea arvoryzae]